MGEQARPTRRLINGEFSRFVIAGAINTAATYALYLMLLDRTGYGLAYTIAYCAGILLSYCLNAVFVFGIEPTFASLLKFPLVYVAQYFAGVAVLWAAIEWLRVPREIALVFAIVVTIPITFVASRLLLKGRLR